MSKPREPWSFQDHREVPGYVQALGVVLGLVVAVVAIGQLVTGLGPDLSRQHPLVASWIFLVLLLGVMALGLLAYRQAGAHTKVDALDREVTRLRGEHSSAQVQVAHLTDEVAEVTQGRDAALARVEKLEARPSRHDRELFTEVMERLAYDSRLYTWLNSGRTKTWTESTSRPLYEVDHAWERRYFDDEVIDMEFQKLRTALHDAAYWYSLHGFAGNPRRGEAFQTADGDTIYYSVSADELKGGHEEWTTMRQPLDDAWLRIRDSREAIERIGRQRRLHE